MEVEHNVVGWFEIPVENMDRAKSFIAEDYGYYAIIIDTEGNRVALHSRK